MSASGAIVLAQAADPEVVHQTTADVLSQADYQVTGGASLLDRALGLLLEALGRFLLRFDTGGGTGSLLAAIALVAVILALVAALVLFLRRLRRGGTLDAVVEGPVGRPPRAWAEEAEAHERAGELRQALRCRYRETVARLAAAHLIDEIPGRTTGEYDRAVRVAVPGASAPFGSLTRAFEETWYGGREVDDALLAAVRSDQTAVLSAADVGRGDRGARGGGGSGHPGAQPVGVGGR